MPKTWDDLLNQRFKGKMVMTNPSFTSLQLGVVAMMSKMRGWSYFERLNANDVMVVQGNEQALNLVKIGEQPIAAGADSQYANEASMAGTDPNVFPATAPLRSRRPPGGEREEPERVSCSRVHAEPGSAEVGPRAASTRRASTSTPAGARIADIKVIPMDFAYITSVTAQVKRRFSEIFST